MEIKEYFRRKGRIIIHLGFNPRQLLSLKHYLKYKKHRSQWLKQGGKILRNYMILSDFDEEAGQTKGHYFHQDLLIAQKINQHKPKRHVDIGSRLDGFVAHVASFREVEVIDIRPMPQSPHKNLKFNHADFMQPTSMQKTDSLSCLHAIEHFGLGRYGDPIDVNGHIKGIENLVKLLEPDGRLYISFPIGKSDEVHFNAHRVFHPRSIINLQCVKKSLRLIQFDFVDDHGDLHTDIDLENFTDKVSYGCGIYTFERKNYN